MQEHKLGNYNPVDNSIAKELFKDSSYYANKYNLYSDKNNRDG